MRFTVKEIVELMEKSAQLGLSVEVIDEQYSIRINGLRVEDPRAILPIPISATQPGAAPALPVAPTSPAPVAEASAAPVPTGRVVKSPIVGTFYASAAPDQPPFVKPGQQVKKSDVLFIIESMKLMNEVTSELEGVVREVLVANGQAVEYGQPILVLD